MQYRAKKFENATEIFTTLGSWTTTFVPALVRILCDLLM